MSEIWQAGQICFLQEAWKTKSAARIAFELGRTRSSVIGKLFRLGLLGSEQSKIKEQANGVMRKMTESVHRQPKARTDLSEPEMRMLSLFELSNNSCRYMVDDAQGIPAFCGVECDIEDQPKRRIRRGPYCPYHAGIVYIPLKPPANAQAAA
jgi:hypothetical protein